MKFKMNNLSIEEINCIYRCISMSMDWRDAVGEELVKEKCTMDWLTYNIEIDQVSNVPLRTGGRN
jgi:hypothetical protein